MSSRRAGGLRIRSLGEAAGEVIRPERAAGPPGIAPVDAVLAAELEAMRVLHLGEARAGADGGARVPDRVGTAEGCLVRDRNRREAVRARSVLGGRFERRREAERRDIELAPWRIVMLVV